MVSNLAAVFLIVLLLAPVAAAAVYFYSSRYNEGVSAGRSESTGLGLQLVSDIMGKLADQTKNKAVKITDKAISAKFQIMASLFDAMNKSRGSYQSIQNFCNSTAFLLNQNVSRLHDKICALYSLGAGPPTATLSLQFWKDLAWNLIELENALRDDP